MKRSEMLEIIRAVISAPRVRFDARTIAKDVLSAIEGLGMLPPKPQSANSDNPIFSELENYIKLVYNWELEDEKK